MNVLITGASRGIGASVTKRFSSFNKIELYLVSRNEKALEQLKLEISKAYPAAGVHLFPVDLSSENNIINLINEIGNHTDSLDIILNNAGYLAKGDFTDISISEINQSLMINYIAPSIIIRESIPLLKNAERAHVVNISSMGGYQGSIKFPGLSHYSASKAAIATLTECLAAEYKENFSINCLAIGAVQTEMLEEAFPGYEAPLESDEMAEFIVNFALESHKYLNGKIIPVSLSNP